MPSDPNLVSSAFIQSSLIYLYTCTWAGSQEKLPHEGTGIYMYTRLLWALYIYCTCTSIVANSLIFEVGVQFTSK